MKIRLRIYRMMFRVGGKYILYLLMCLKRVGVYELSFFSANLQIIFIQYFNLKASKTFLRNFSSLMFFIEV